MGCCCSRSSEEVVESTSINSSVSSRIGKHGVDVKISSNPTANSFIVKGSGTAIGSCILECDSAYWEVKIGENPQGVRLGIKRNEGKQTKALNGYLDDVLEENNANKDSIEDTWYLKDVEYKKDDVIGVYWDQIDLPMLSFSINGKMMTDSSYLRIRPANNIIPAVSVRDGSSCEVIFDGNNFSFPPKSSRFGSIVCASSLI